MKVKTARSKKKHWSEEKKMLAQGQIGFNWPEVNLVWKFDEVSKALDQQSPETGIQGL